MKVTAGSQLLGRATQSRGITGKEVADYINCFHWIRRFVIRTLYYCLFRAIALE